jgi:uncharacterized protein DUF3305
MNIAPALATIAVGVIVERRRAASPWIDFTWRPVSVLAGQPETPPWTMLTQGADSATFYLGAAQIELHRTETANYRNNMCSGSPMLWVVLRPTGREPPYELFAVTADPAEGEALTEAASDLVEMVPMPPAICAQIEAFVAEHHVERPFYKRERDRADPESLARRAPTAKEKE